MFTVVCLIQLVIIQLIDTIVKIYRKPTMYPALFQSIICNPHQTQWNRHDLSPFSKKRNWGPTISKWQCRNVKCKPSASRVLSLTTGLLLVQGHSNKEDFQLIFGIMFNYLLAFFLLVFQSGGVGPLTTL